MRTQDTFSAGGNAAPHCKYKNKEYRQNWAHFSFSDINMVLKSGGFVFQIHADIVTQQVMKTMTRPRFAED